MKLGRNSRLQGGAVSTRKARLPLPAWALGPRIVHTSAPARLRGRVQDPGCLLTQVGTLLAACGPPPAQELAPIRVSGSYWIELTPVVVAAQRFYPEQLAD